MNNYYLMISVIISAISIILSVKNFSKSKIKLKMLIPYILIICPLFFMINIYVNGIIKVLLILITITISLYFSLFNKNVVDSLYYAVVYEILSFFGEIITSVLLVSVFNFNIETYNTMSLSILIFSLANSILVYLISLIKPLNKLIRKVFKIIGKKQYEIVIIIVIIMLMTLLLFFNKNNLGNDFTFYINVGMIIFIFIFLIYIIYNSIQKNKLENNYDEMMEYVCKYEKIINDQGKKNHEYNNQLMVIKGYVNNPKKLNEYLDLIINEHKCGQNYTIRELSYFPDGGIKGLIYHKISKMEDKNIKYYLYIDKNTKDVFEKKFDVKTYQDITKLLGVFLDNAIDAVVDAKKKEIEFEIKIQDDCLIINISNTFNKKSDLKQIGKKGFTTKGIGHGYGLSIVKDITKSNDKIETFKDIDEDKFSQTILIYYK